MHDLSYSNDALNVRGAFFGVKTIIYVEGDDDVLFWEQVFSRVTVEPFEVEAVGGAPTLDNYIHQIVSGELDGIAARDADFLPITGKICHDPRIVYTFGYSIENSLYVASTVAQLVRLWCKSPRVTEFECAGWLNEFAVTVAPLVHLDVANTISVSGVPTLGDNCSRYMTSHHSATACPSKVAAAAASSAAKIPSEFIISAKDMVGIEPDAVLTHLRGHFLASATHRYVVSRAKKQGRKVSLSTESLYAVAIVLFSNALDAGHPHKAHYLTLAQAAWQAV